MKSKPVSVMSFKEGRGFFAERKKLVREVMLPYQYKVLNDEIEGVEKSHAMENLRLSAKALRGEKPDGEFYGFIFQDSDIAKWLEAAAYSLSEGRNAELEAQMDEVIELLGECQHSDGYLNSYFTLVAPDKKWTDLQEAHELYCAGHMMEAACAYYETTGKDRLLNIMKKNADCIYEHFIKSCPRGYPGHPEVELALIKLYRLSGDDRYLELSKHFIDVRGLLPHYFIEEKATRGWNVWNSDANDTDYTQSTLPVREEENAVGHSVRALYLYSAMADAAKETNDAELKAACDRMWKSITERRMYVTGGVGSAEKGEAFTVDYDLPNAIVYAETCASIALVFFARRMLEMEAKGNYGDVMERALYNTVLAGMQLDGKRFFYVNPLEVIPGISGKSVTQEHALPERPGWYSCACCPPNVARLIASIGSYAYTVSEDTLFAHLFVDGTVDTGLGWSLSCETDYPHNGDIAYTFNAEKRAAVAVRIPAWSKSTRLSVNGEELKLSDITRDGYAYISRDFKNGDKIELSLDMTPFKVYASTKVPAATGCAAVQRGPLVYCAEGADNAGDVLSLSLKRGGELHAESYDPDLLCGIVPVTAEGWRTDSGEELYSFSRPERREEKIRLIPYYAWANRGINQMRVWLPET